MLSKRSQHLAEIRMLQNLRYKWNMSSNVSQNVVEKITKHHAFLSVQKCVHLVDLEKCWSMKTGIWYYLLAKIGFDAAKNEPSKAYHQLISATPDYGIRITYNIIWPSPSWKPNNRCGRTVWGVSESDHGYVCLQAKHKWVVFEKLAKSQHCGEQVRRKSAL